MIPIGTYVYFFKYFFNSTYDLQQNIVIKFFSKKKYFSINKTELLLFLFIFFSI